MSASDQTRAAARDLAVYRRYLELTPSSAERPSPPANRHRRPSRPWTSSAVSVARAKQLTSLLSDSGATSARRTHTLQPY
jgi:hypothetical protein